MTKFNFHGKNAKSFNSLSKNRMLVIQKLVDAYKLWHQFLPHFPKTARYTLGAKIDSFFVETIELLIGASHLDKDRKIPYVQQSILKLDLLKFFLQVFWEIKALDNKKFILLSEKLDEIGRMTGGWLKQLSKENPATGGERR